ncbi:MAG: hypothetical protein NWE94_07250, partial [Candidatus Bathyarchaeota archaeon]|nr:hypothetical protein [Candidatus Bathyarchaeota archaeon]
ETDSVKEVMQFYAQLKPLDTSTCPDVHMPSTPDHDLKSQTSHNYLDKTERSSKEDAKTEKSRESALTSFDDFVSIHWSEKGFGWHKCAVCGYTKLTCCQAETFKNEAMWLCEDCQTEWESRKTGVD